VEKGPNYTADPSGLRTGNPPDEKMVEVLQQEALSLEDYISKVFCRGTKLLMVYPHSSISQFCSLFPIIQDQVQRKVPLTIQEINNKINYVRGAVTMAYPMGLPEWDLVRIALDEPIEKLKVSFFHLLRVATKMMNIDKKIPQCMRYSTEHVLRRLFCQGRGCIVVVMQQRVSPWPTGLRSAGQL